MQIKRTVYSIVAASVLLTCSAFALPDTEKAVFDETPATIKADDIKPATIKNLKEVENETQKETKEQTKTDEEKATAETPDVNKDLPVLEDIKLPAIEKKAVDNKPVKIEVSSQRIPMGTVLPIKLETTINSVSSAIGDQFNATLTSDVIISDNVVLPAGSVLRGTIGKIQKANLCVREAKIMLMFDHIVTPAGKQLPIYAYMQADANINYEGYITGGTSYSKAFKKDAAKSKDIIVKSTNYGVEKGMAYLGGVPVVLTAPICAIGGTLGGGGYIIGKSVYNVFVKGGEVLLNKGTALNITLSKALDVPVN